MQGKLLLRKEKMTTSKIARICNKEVHDGGKRWNLQQKKTKRFYTFILPWNWIWLIFNLWNWWKRKGQRSLEKPCECMREEPGGQGQGCSLWKHAFLCLQKDTADLCARGLETDVCKKKAKKLWKKFVSLIFSLSLEFKTKKKWKCTFSNEHWFLLQGRIWLVLKAF